MAIFREVEVYPNGGFAKRRWADDRDVDAFARASTTPAPARPG